MSVVETFERSALFNITRGVALVCVSVFLLAVAGVVIFGATLWPQQVSTKVTPAEIITLVKPPPVQADAPPQPAGVQPPTGHDPRRSPLYGYRIPFALQNYISGDDATILKNHLDAVPTAERQAYIDELGAVVTAAEASKVDVTAAINAYMTTKAARYEAAEQARVSKQETLTFGAMGVGIGLSLIALFSLVLVLLAIERNTRPASARSTGEPT